jgi:[acyl-carrier-protein] S-malonyltransferase
MTTATHHHHDHSTGPSATGQTRRSPGCMTKRSPGRALNRRLQALRHGPHTALLPRPGSPEDRQLARWTAHVLAVERLCELEATHRQLPRASSRALTALAATELGSITAAAYTASAAVRAVYAAITDVASDQPQPFEAAGAAQYLLRHRLYADQAAAAAAGPADLAPMGEAALDELPAALADAVRAAGTGDLIGPVWQPPRLARGRRRRRHRPRGRRPGSATGSIRRRLFVRWLDQARSTGVRMAPGFEHPGDPAQPDNHHRH